MPAMTNAEAPAAHDDALSRGSCGSREFKLFYAHRRSPSASRFEEGSAVEAVRELSASDQTHFSGILWSPVSTQVQVKRLDMRLIGNRLFMVPPSAVRGKPASSGARGAEGQGSANHRFGRSECGGYDLAHTLNSQVAHCEER
jgi:hypothetical protein